MTAPKKEWKRYICAPALGIQGLHAHFNKHEYERHFHDYFVLGTIDAGAPKVGLDRESFIAPSGTAMIINPGQSHDGKPCDEQGYVYSMVYIEPWVISNIAEELEASHPGNIMFTQNIIADQDIVFLLKKLHRTLFCDPDHLARESALIAALTPILQRFSTGRSMQRLRVFEPRIERVRELIHAKYSNNLTTADLAEAASLSRVRLNQLFSTAYGLPLHAYLNAVRLDAAKVLLRAGHHAAEVAISVGLTDQSHLIRRFKGSFGITPAQFTAGHLSDIQ